MDRQARINPHSVSGGRVCVVAEWEHQPDVDGVQRALIGESDQLRFVLFLFLPAQMLPSTYNM